ncbi:MAG: gamma-glutamyltransferase family protein, partial [Bryobacteraceae bacterium]
MRTLLLSSLIVTTCAAQPQWRTVVMGTNGMVAAEHPLEARAGMRVLEAGGNAIDAAVATFYMTTVVEQHQAGIGGDAFVLAYIAKEKRVVFVNGTGRAPRGATPDFYRQLGGIPAEGPYSSTLPGAVAGFELARARWGTMPQSRLVADAAEAAAKGHALTHWSASNYVSALKKILAFPSSRVLLKDGRPWAAGDLLVQPDLARTLSTLGREGAESFYTGSLARLTASFYERQKGLIRLDDLAAVRAEQAEPIRTRYKDYDVYQCAPNSQGIVLLMALNILEGVDLRKAGRNSGEYLHWVVEALKLAFADRDQYIADPEFIKGIPVDALLAKGYAGKRRTLIRPDRAMRGAAPPGDPRSGGAVLAGRAVAYEDGPQTPVTGAAPAEA